MVQIETETIKKESQYGIKNREQFVKLVVHVIDYCTQVVIGDAPLIGVEGILRQVHFAGQVGRPD